MPGPLVDSRTRSKFLTEEVDDDAFSDSGSETSIDSDLSSLSEDSFGEERSDTPHPGVGGTNLAPSIDYFAVPKKPVCSIEALPCPSSVKHGIRESMGYHNAIREAKYYTEWAFFHIWEQELKLKNLLASMNQALKPETEADISLDIIDSKLRDALIEANEAFIQRNIKLDIHAFEEGDTSDNHFVLLRVLEILYQKKFTNYDQWLKVNANEEADSRASTSNLHVLYNIREEDEELAEFGIRREEEAIERLEEDVDIESIQENIETNKGRSEETLTLISKLTEKCTKLQKRIDELVVERSKVVTNAFEKFTNCITQKSKRTAKELDSKTNQFYEKKDELAEKVQEQVAIQEEIESLKNKKARYEKSLAHFHKELAKHESEANFYGTVKKLIKILRGDDVRGRHISSVRLMLIQGYIQEQIQPIMTEVSNTKRRIRYLRGAYSNLYSQLKDFREDHSLLSEHSKMNELRSICSQLEALMMGDKLAAFPAKSIEEIKYEYTSRKHTDPRILSKKGFRKLYGLGTKKDETAGIIELKAAYAHGSFQAAKHLADASAKGIGLEKNFMSALALYKVATERAAEAGEEAFAQASNQAMNQLIMKTIPEEDEEEE